MSGGHDDTSMLVAKGGDAQEVQWFGCNGSNGSNDSLDCEASVGRMLIFQV